MRKHSLSLLYGLALAWLFISLISSAASTRPGYGEPLRTYYDNGLTWGLGSFFRSERITETSAIGTTFTYVKTTYTVYWGQLINTRAGEGDPIPENEKIRKSWNQLSDDERTKIQENTDLPTDILEQIGSEPVTYTIFILEAVNGTSVNDEKFEDLNELQKRVDALSPEKTQDHNTSNPVTRPDTTQTSGQVGAINTENDTTNRNNNTSTIGDLIPTSLVGKTLTYTSTIAGNDTDSGGSTYTLYSTNITNKCFIALSNNNEVPPTELIILGNGQTYRVWLRIENRSTTSTWRHLAILDIPNGIPSDIIYATLIAAGLNRELASIIHDEYTNTPARENTYYVTIPLNETGEPTYYPGASNYEYSYTSKNERNYGSIILTNWGK